MPVTPLHMGLMAPVVHRWGLKRTWSALVSYALVNLWLDLDAILAWLRDQPLPSHDESWHTMHGALLFAGFISVFGILSWRWISGAFFGAVSHIYLDGMVHPEMQPFVDTQQGNPIYLGAMVPVSVALMPLTCWLIALIVLRVSSSLGSLRTRAAVRSRRSAKRSP
jgi:membrane-bound metal-dependent hydrolase YbcI (DUF457 family)